MSYFFREASEEMRRKFLTESLSHSVKSLQYDVDTFIAKVNNGSASESDFADFRKLISNDTWVVCSLLDDVIDHVQNTVFPDYSDFPD